MCLCQERPTVADNGSMNSQSADVRQTLGVSDRKEDKSWNDTLLLAEWNNIV
jgi:hypothetical protein